MNADGMDDLRAELLDDFYAECDELLGNVRRELLVVERSAGDLPARSAAVEGCFRSIHSLKGNSAIVGLKPAEELAHAAEGRLRDLLHAHAAVDREQLDLLAQTALRLEQIVSGIAACSR